MRGRGRPFAPLFALVLLFVILAIAIVQERIEEIPHIPYELSEYVGVGVADLGTQRLFSNPSSLSVTVTARRAGRVRFILTGDGGLAEDPAKRALSRRMRDLCRRGGCDFVLFAGDNFYQNGIDTFEGVRNALADSIPNFSLQSDFLNGRDPAEARTIAARVRAAAGRVARACGRARADPPVGLALVDSSAAAANEVHFEPKFEQTFPWLKDDGVPAFVALGNHDTRPPFGVECEIGYSLSRTPWTLPYYFYQVRVVDPASRAPLAALFVLYSAPLHGSRTGENYVGIGPRQSAWLRSALAALEPSVSVQRQSSSARSGTQAAAGNRDGAQIWTLFLTHHPIWSAGPHTLTEYRSLPSDLLAAFDETGTRPDLLLGGHNHWLESVKVEVGGRPALQIVSGALSKVALGLMLSRGYPLVNVIAFNAKWRAKLAQDLQTDPNEFLRADRSVLARGFALVEIEGAKATVRFYGVGGELYREELVRGGLAPAEPVRAAAAPGRPASTTLSALPRARASASAKRNQRQPAGSERRRSRDRGAAEEHRSGSSVSVK